ARRMVSAAADGASPKPFSRSAETGRSVAATMARAWASASSRATLPSRRPSTPAAAPLDVASAWKPSAARARAEPASPGVGITKAPGPSWRAGNRMALSLWVAVMGGVPLREPKPPRRPGLPAAGPRPRWTSGRSGLADRLDLAVAVAGQPVLVAPQLLVELLD